MEDGRLLRELHDGRLLRMLEDRKLFRELEDGRPVRDGAMIKYKLMGFRFIFNLRKNKHLSLHDTFVHGKGQRGCFAVTSNFAYTSAT
jgi:hypothetical protein